MNLPPPTALRTRRPTFRARPPFWIPWLVLAALFALALQFTERQSEPRLDAAPLGSAVATEISATHEGDGQTDAVPIPTSPTTALDMPAIEIGDKAIPVAGRLPPNVHVSTVTTPTRAPEDRRSPGCPWYTLLGTWFDRNLAAIHRDAGPVLDGVAAGLNEERWPIVIVGHTDIRPTNFPGGNQGLSEARAQAVAAELIDRGIDPARISTIGRGATEPARVGTTEDDHQENRRALVTTLC